ncbi:hypothetical protein ACLOJK_024639 [Asimina triloba]
MARFRFEMDHDRSGMELNLLITGEEDSPRVAAVISVGLRLRRIWNVLVVSVVMSGLDRGDNGPTVMGLDGNKLAFDGVVHRSWTAASSADSSLQRASNGGPTTVAGGDAVLFASGNCHPFHVVVVEHHRKIVAEKDDNVTGENQRQMRNGNREGKRRRRCQLPLRTERSHKEERNPKSLTRRQERKGRQGRSKEENAMKMN